MPCKERKKLPGASVALDFKRVLKFKWHGHVDVARDSDAVDSTYNGRHKLVEV